MDLGGIRSLYLPLRPKARFSPGRKTPPGISAPSAGLRPLIVSRVKCGGGPCRGHSVLPCTGNTICLHCAFIKGARFGICLRKHVVAATGPSAIHSGRIPPHGHLQPGTEDSAIPLTTPDMVRSGRVLPTSVKSPFQFYFSLPFFVNFLSSQYAHSGPAIHTEE